MRMPTLCQAKTLSAGRVVQVLPGRTLPAITGGRPKGAQPHPDRWARAKEHVTDSADSAKIALASSGVGRGWNSFVSIKTLRRLLEERRWELCAALAADLLASGELPPSDRAYAAYARRRSQSNLDQYILAADVGRTAVVLAEENGLVDLPGRALSRWHGS